MLASHSHMTEASIIKTINEMNMKNNYQSSFSKTMIDETVLLQDIARKNPPPSIMKTIA